MVTAAIPYPANPPLIGRRGLWGRAGQGFQPDNPRNRAPACAAAIGRCTTSRSKGAAIRRGIAPDRARRMRGRIGEAARPQRHDAARPRFHALFVPVCALPAWRPSRSFVTRYLSPAVAATAFAAALESHATIGLEKGLYG